MSEDWIKMRKALGNHPKVVQMASHLSTDRFRIVGGLHAAWSLFDTYSANGYLPGYTPQAMGEAIGWPGFDGAMVRVEWLIVSPEGLQMPRPDTHNSESARKRAIDAERKRVQRLSEDKPDKERTDIRPEKEKEKEKKDQKQKPIAQQAARFDEFWSLYPSRPGTSKSGKKPCKTKWEARGLDRLADVILADVEIRIRLDKQWKDGFVPDPCTYINQDRWADGFSALQPPPTNGGGVSPRKPETAESHLAAVDDWARNMRAMCGVPEAEIQEQVDRVYARYGTGAPA